MTSPKPSLEDLRIDRSSAAARRRGWAGPAVFSLVVAAFVAGGAWWWATRTQAATVRTTTVRESAESAGAVLNASGYVTARRRATVSSKVTGKIIEVLVEEGMAVRKGQVLARLDDSSTRAHLQLAESQLVAARRAPDEIQVRIQEATVNLERMRRLVKEGVAGQAQLDTAQAEADSLRARLEVAREQVAVAERQVAVRRTELDDTVIRAPFTGVAISKDAQPGEMVSPVSAGGGFTRTGICTLVDMSSLEIEVDVNEAYINRVRPEQRVEAVLDAYPDWRIPARVITTVPTADRQRATVLVRIAFDRLDPRVIPDMGVKVTFLESAPAAAEARPRVRLLVPRPALRKHGGADVVFVVKGDVVERRAVKLGAADGDQVEVVAGLTAGERIVVDGPPDLADGDRVVAQ